jgi:hypothetical protein
MQKDTSNNIWKRDFKSRTTSKWKEIDKLIRSFKKTAENIVFISNLWYKCECIKHCTKNKWLDIEKR